MLTANSFEYKKRLFYFIALLLLFYVFVPYVLWFYDDYFIKSVLSNFPIADYSDPNYLEEVKIYQYILSIFNNVNIHFIFFMNLGLFIIFFFYFKFLISNRETHSQTILFKVSYKDFYLLLNILLIICLIILFKDIIDFIYYLELSNSLNLVDWRGMGYNFFQGRKQTHYVIGSVVAVYLISKNFYKIPIIFLILLIFLEFASLSRFYMIQVTICLILLCSKKYLKFLIIIFFFIASYRILLLSEINSFLNNLLWEPISIWCTEIVKILNAESKISSSDVFYNYIIKNLKINFIFFDKFNSSYIFTEDNFEQFGSYSNFGIIDLIAFPIQHIILFFLTIIINKKIFKNNSEINKIILILSVFSIFKILRGSSLYGLSFIFKFQLLILLLLFGFYLIKKLQFFKSSS